MGNVAGSLTYDTKLDTDGFEKSLSSIGSAAKGLAIGVGAAVVATGAAIGKVVKDAISNYAEFEQLAGGVESMFGGMEKGADQINKVMGYSKTAWKDLTMSQNDYINTFNSAYPLMKNDIKDQNEAIEQTNRLLTLESDLSNTFGYSMETASTAVNWALKGTFSYIDNLNIGIKGTQEGFLEAAHNAGYMVDDVKELTSSDILDILEKTADQYGVLGKTADEALGTIQGSTKMVKASWSNLLTGLADDNADFEQLVNDLVTSLQAAFTNLVPRIITALKGIGEAIPVLINALMEHLPEILDAGEQILNGLIDAIITALPQIVSAGGRILQALLDGIIKIMPQLVPVVIQIINTIINFIVDNLPTIIQTGIEVLLALVEGIVEMIPTLIDTIIDLVFTMVDMILDNLDVFIMAAIDIILALAFGLIDAIPKLLEKIPEIIVKLTLALTDPAMLAKLVTAAIQLIIALSGGLIKAIPELLLAVPRIISGLFKGIKDRITQTDWLGLGKNVLKGILNGMLDFGNIVKDTIKKVGNKITNSIKSFFGIHSPSKLMQKEIGDNLILGLGVSFKEDGDLIDNDIDKLGEEVTDKMQNAVSLENGKYSFSGTSGSVSEILSSNATFDGTFNVEAKVQEGVLFETTQRITKQKNLQTGFGG